MHLKGIVFHFCFLKKVTILKYYISKLCLELSVLFYRSSNKTFLTTFVIYFNVYSHVNLWFIASKLVLDYKICSALTGGTLHFRLALVKSVLIC